MTVDRLGSWLLWLVIYALTTVGLYAVSGRPDIRTSHAILSYLVLIIGASRQGSRGLSMAMVVLSYLAVDWLFIPPKFTLGAASDLDWFVLLGFLATGWLVSELFAKQREATRVAEERTREVERLSAERLQLERDASTVRALREADRLKNALLNSLAHDLRSPVSTLSLLADPAAGFPISVVMQRVGEEAGRLGEYIATLQRFASEGGGSVLATSPRAADEIVQTAIRSSEAVIAGRLLRVNQATAVPPVLCDLTLSVQVIGNLLQNAVRYAPASEPIDIDIREDAGFVVFVVGDRGPGVAGTDLDRLFMPLRRSLASADSPMAATETRMGMGLAIARTFARAQRGDVMYKPRDGGGAEFVVRLPRATA
ncbi:sensor histidine kinase [Gemmatimonas sp.]